MVDARLILPQIFYRPFNPRSLSIDRRIPFFPDFNTPSMLILLESDIMKESHSHTRFGSRSSGMVLHRLTLRRKPETGSSRVL